MMTRKNDFALLTEAFIYSIYDYWVNGPREGQVLPFVTAIEEAEGVRGIDEDEFFLLLDIYEGDGDALIADNLMLEDGTYPILEAGNVTHTDLPITQVGSNVEYLGSTTTSQGSSYSVLPPQNPPRKIKQKKINRKESKTDKSITGWLKDVSGAEKEPSLFTGPSAVIKASQERWGSPDKSEIKISSDGVVTIDNKALKEVWTVPGLEFLKKQSEKYKDSVLSGKIKRMEEMSKKARKRAAVIQRKYDVEIEKLMHRLETTAKGQDRRTLKRKIKMLQKENYMRQEAEFALFISQYKRAMKAIREKHPGFIRGLLFGDRGHLDSKYGEGILKGSWRRFKSLLFGKEELQDKVIVQRLASKDKRRSPGLVHYITGRRELPGEPVETPAQKFVFGQGKTFNRGRGGLIGKARYYLFGAHGPKQFKYHEYGLLGSEAIKDYKHLAKKLSQLDKEALRLKWQLNKVSPKTEKYAQLNDKYQELTAHIKLLNKNRKQYERAMKVARRLQAKQRRFKMKLSDVKSEFGPLIAVVATSLVAAGVVWFKARHSRLMLKLATERVIREAALRGMTVTPKEIKHVIKSTLRSSVKVRDIAHAIERAKRGVAIDRAANLLAAQVIHDMGIGRIPPGHMQRLGMQRLTPQGINTGQFAPRTISVNKSLAPFSM